jgi:hypothetical protein
LKRGRTSQQNPGAGKGVWESLSEQTSPDFPL